MVLLRTICFVLLFPCLALAEFRAGAFAVDIAPPELPVRVNAMFTERTGDKIADSLLAKAMALDDGTTCLVLCVVDSCMLPRDLIDQAKSEASKVTGVPVERMLVSATHTHSAPSAMGCLGSREDTAYVRFLPKRITAAIVGAVQRLQPARIGSAQADAPEHTFNRRWIRRPDRILSDPFGLSTVRANMHPGHQSPDVIGPSGPVDPQLSVLAVQSREGKPLALLANFSMHYCGSPLLSSDYFGRFATHLSTELGADESFVGMMSQGTSGDLMWMDYSAPPRKIDYDGYGKEIAHRVAAMVRGIHWRDDAPLKMAERSLALAYRTPDEKRLAWAREITAKLGDKLPQSHAEIYALEALQLHDRQRTELKLQALRIGEVGITAIPNEVFAITGLKLKRQSPLASTFNIELANGAEGYIPPPEQHALGGYATWPARTAGLEVEAEPRIVDTLISLLEEVAEKPRRPLVEDPTPCSAALLDKKPLVYWRLGDMSVPVARDIVGSHDATYEPGVALYLPGIGAGHAAHFAGGRVRANVFLGGNYTVSFWLWNGLPHDARAVTGYAFSRGSDGDKDAPGEHLGIGGTFRGDLAGKLILFNGNERNEVLAGRTTLALRAWHHVTLVREGGMVRVHLDGRADPEIAGTFASTVPSGEDSIFVGGRSDGMFGFEGKMAEVAIFPRPLTPAEIASLYGASGQKPPVGEAPPVPAIEPPLEPLASLAKIHLQPGYGIELVASEPLTADPVAIDWSPDGRLWVVEMADYPVGMDGNGAPGGRIRVLEDLDGDGRYDKSILFADRLNFPTGLLTWRDGVIVTAAPDIVFLRDTDGDGKADFREVLVSGLSTGNQQLRANGLRWGLDGWVYCAAGGHHGEYGVGTKLRTRLGDVLVGSRDFRFKPDSGEVEPESGPSQFGRNRDDWGHWFGTQNSRPLWHYVLPDHYLLRNPHIATPDPRQQVVVPLNPKVWPLSPQEKRYHSFNEGGHFTSACSGMIYRDELLFGKGAVGEMHAFTCEPFHNLVQHNIITDSGVSFTARRAPGEERSEFFSSEDRWCRPVMTRTGPDGALWVVDMYRYIIEHPEWLPKEARDELLPLYRLGEERGRIYRVFPSGVSPRRIAPLNTLSTADLVAALDSPNEWQRDKAHMMLTWRGEKTAVPLLEKLANESANPLARLHALCLVDTAPAVLRALSDPHAALRENALRLAERHPTPEVISASLKLVDDPSAKVRLQLAFTLGEWKDPAAGQALALLAVRDHVESFMVAAVLSSATHHLGSLTDAVHKAGGEPLRVFGGSLAKLTRELANPAPPVVARLPEARSKAPVTPPDRAEVINRFQPALKLTGNPANGQVLFNQLCIVCHRMGEVGNEVGPNLVSVASHPPEKLLVNILDPSADVQPGYYAYQCQLVDGSEIFGLIATESANSITFKLADGTSRALLRKEIASLQSARASLMPAGFEAALDAQKLADLISFLRAGDVGPSAPETVPADILVGAAAVNLRATDDMPLAGYLEARFTKEQEGELRAVAVVVEKPGESKVAIVTCDVLWVTRAIVDRALEEIERTTGIPPSQVLVNATHTHHAPGTAPAHAFGWSEKFASEVRRGIVQSVQEANSRLGAASLFFQIGEERTVGANSRLLLEDTAISWLNPLAEAGAKVQPTDAFDPQLPVLDFRAPDGKSRALIFNHSTHTIGTKSGRDVRSPSFYGLAAQDLEQELGGVASFLEGASGSTHNIRGVPVPVAIERMKRAVLDARQQAKRHPVTRLSALKVPFTFRVRTFDEATEAAKVARYTSSYAKSSAPRINEIFSSMRRELAPLQGEVRSTTLQAMVIGDVAIVGVPAEYFTALGLDIKRRSPFRHTVIAELANDWIGYLPTRRGQELGGYQTWTGLHSYAEAGTGERMADEAIKLLEWLAAQKSKP